MLNSKSDNAYSEFINLTLFNLEAMVAKEEEDIFGLRLHNLIWKNLKNCATYT